MQNLLHQPRSLLRIEEILRVSRAFEDDQLLRRRRLCVVAGNLRQSRPIAAAVLAPTINSLRPVSLAGKSPPEEPKSTMRSISPGADRASASPTASPPILPPITETRLIPLLWRYSTPASTSVALSGVNQTSLGSIRILPVSSKGDRQYNEPCPGQPLCLLPPTGLIETPAVR